VRASSHFNTLSLTNIVFSMAYPTIEMCAAICDQQKARPMTPDSTNDASNHYFGKTMSRRSQLIEAFRLSQQKQEGGTLLDNKPSPANRLASVESTLQVQVKEIASLRAKVDTIPDLKGQIERLNSKFIDIDYKLSMIPHDIHSASLRELCAAYAHFGCNHGKTGPRSSGIAYPSIPVLDIFWQPLIPIYDNQIRRKASRPKSSTLGTTSSN
jgi:hypothetical protein